MMNQMLKAHISVLATSIPRTHTLALALLVLTTACSKQEDPRNSQVVDGVTIYIGVVPSRVVRGHPGTRETSPMHAGVPTTGRSDHVVVALFEDVTGKRIEDAQVTGSITEIGMGSDRKKFERMTTDASITYGGNFFNMPAGHDYHLKLWISQPGNKKAVEATFSHVSLGE
jgi:hypothetical protein